MIRWEVRGADRRTGSDRSTYVFGHDEQEATNAASAVGIVVESIHRATDASEIPDYEDIPRATGWLQVWVTVIGLVGGLVLAMGAILVIVNAVPLVNDRMDGLQRAAAWSSLYAGISGIVSGAFLLTVAAALNCLASYGSAIRDIARNSHR